MSNRNGHDVKIRIDSLGLSFGGVNALTDVSIDIREKEILAIIGPNGAGKTCLLNCINGFYKPQKGDIYYGDRKITGIRPDNAAKLGLARTFQNIELFSGMNTLDNIMAARHMLMKQNVLTGALYFGWAHTEEIKHRRTVEDIIDFLEIEPIRKKIVGTLPYGMRKRVELGRALAMEPKLLLLDEPTSFLDLKHQVGIYDLLKVAQFEKNKTIVAITHDINLACQYCDKVLLLVGTPSYNLSQNKAQPDSRDRRP